MEAVDVGEYASAARGDVVVRQEFVSSRRDGQEIRLNFHVLFSDEVPSQHIEEHFLHDLDFYYQGEPQGPDEKRKLKVSNLEDLGKTLLGQHEEFRRMNLSPLQLGAMQAGVDDEQVTNILTRDSRFKGKFLIILPADGWDDINWNGQAHLIRKGLLQKADVVFSSNVKTRDWCLGAPPYVEGAEQFVKEFRSLKPCVHGSDAHRIDEMGHPCVLRGEREHDCRIHSNDCDLRNCWVKADPTFEGLKQLLYEPSERVAIQSEDPTPLKTSQCISGFKSEPVTVSAELALDKIDLSFNSGLVAVTGGKGSGKTALVDLIANFFKDRSNTKDPNSFVRRIVGDGANFESSLKFLDGKTIEKSLAERRFVQRAEIVYIAQGELEQYIGEGSDLEKHVRDLIYQSPQVKNTVKVFEFDEQDKNARGLEKRLIPQIQQIEKLERGTASLIVEAAHRQRLQIETKLADLEAKIPVLQARLSEEKLNVIQEEQQKRSALLARKEHLKEAQDLLAMAQSVLETDLLRFNDCVTRLNVILFDLRVEGSLPTLIYVAGEGVGPIKAKIDAELLKVVGEIEASEKELLGYEVSMQEHAATLAQREELRLQLEAAVRALEVIASEARQLAAARQERDRIFGELLKSVLKQKDKYAEVIDLFAHQKSAVLSDLDFKATIHFDKLRLLGGLEEIVDNRQVHVLGDEHTKSEFDDLLRLYDDLVVDRLFSVDEIVAETSRICEAVKSKIKKSQAIGLIDFYRCMYSSYMRVVPVVTYKRTALNKLSLGQKATVLIKIHLAQGTNTIMIDSHDDHLDNEFIMDELVGAIRQAKTYRQVILASNNGNVVINSDAEQIIVANRQGGVISYSSGSIEDAAIRGRALQVLEGGAAAFRKRQEKYGLES